MQLVGGRMDTHVEYAVGFDAQGRIRGLRLSIWTLIGAYPDASFEAFVIKRASTW
jgi:xanthine dehydrogenase molybdopterin-binding subunit B